ncbi:MAG: DUF3883 domain-containing protein [Candidatus Delongbacteria bacterium]|nr:DUF3883 domain-containing protein [Candidatus Delongbacteria bacterium]MCG2760239.1 DUF3883 domain-containing protein [Candidatus Delongbacteria bacterium]
MAVFVFTFIISFIIIYGLYKSCEDSYSEIEGYLNLIRVGSFLATFGLIFDYIIGDGKYIRFLTPCIAILTSFIVNLIITNIREEDKRVKKWKAEKPDRERHEEEYERKCQREDNERKRQEQDKLAKEQAKVKVEMNAMNHTMKFERSKYRNPVDVSSLNLGYDIKSSDSSNTRFIEVKGRTESGDVEITSNEWSKAKELDNNYFLYVVFKANSDYPDLYTVQNPAKKLNATFDSQNDKYIISRNEITNYYS